MSAPVSEISRASIGLRSERGPILLAVMTATGLVAIDSTILATAVPSVVNDLGGFSQFPWLFSIYLLTQAVTVPIYGKLADVWGRKPVLLLGIVLFLLGSLLSGAAWSMGSLIAFRALQGIGAGAVQPTGMTIMGDIYSVEERAKVQGYIAGVWAAASLVGPTLGGAFSDYLSWRWIFYVNLPIGLIAIFLIQRDFKEKLQRHAHEVDYLGAGLITASGVALLLGLIEGGVQWAWGSPQSVGLFVVSALTAVGFVVVEQRAAEPVLPLWVFQRRPILSSILGSFIIGCAMLGLSSYVPLFGQGVLGHGAVVAGLALAAMTFGWPISSSYAGRLYLTIGFRWTILVGSLITIVGGLLLLPVSASTSIWMLALPCFVIGLGFGLVASPGLIAAQSAVEWKFRGVATGANMFGRNMGSAVGVAVFGAIANGRISSRLHGKVPSDLSKVPRGILEPAVHAVFVFAAIVVVVLAVTAFVMPRHDVTPFATAE